tara:strand:- start:794 stop:2227 length:1434 start_codon:yes stop_codon:yes gene_type:complete
MVFPILGANTESAAYEVENSLRFNDGDSPKVSRSVSSSGSARNATLSVWVKRGILGTRQQIYSNKTADSGFSAMNMYFYTDDKLYIDHHDGSNNKSLYTNQVFRDVSAWYHIVHTIDTTTGTATNRLRLYINGTEVTDFATDQNPSQNADLALSNSTGDQSIGDDPRDNNDLFDGYMAEYNFVDGTTLDPTYFGETNDNGVWIPKKPDVSSYGTNGFYLEFKQTGTSANSSGIGADTSGNDNHMSVTNLAAIDVTTDTPTNNFCTLNPLSAKTLTFSEGNLHATNNGGAGSATGTIAPTNGKWYFEITLSGAANFAAGVVNLDDWASGTDIYSYGEAAAVLIENNANYNVTYGNTASSPSTLQTGTQLQTAKYGFAMDIDNNDLYVSANGNWYTGSAFDNTSFSSASAVTTDLPSNVPLTAFIRNPDSVTARCNFGNPAGADTISSGNADANGYGNFEYAVPSGYYSLCTKNLAEYG